MWEVWEQPKYGPSRVLNVGFVQESDWLIWTSSAMVAALAFPSGEVQVVASTFSGC